MGGNIIEPFNTNIYLQMAIWENHLKNHPASECLGVVIVGKTNSKTPVSKVYTSNTDGVLLDLPL
jgi:hypothetical protein